MYKEIVLLSIMTAKLCIIPVAASSNQFVTKIITFTVILRNSRFRSCRCGLKDQHPLC